LAGARCATDETRTPTAIKGTTFSEVAVTWVEKNWAPLVGGCTLAALIVIGAVVGALIGWIRG